MKIVFISNYLNHHQKPFLECLVDLGCDVTFVALGKISEMRKSLGYGEVSFSGRHIQYTQELASEIVERTLEADAVIFTSVPKNLYRKRIETGKLTFRFSERLFKKSFLQEIAPWYLHKYRKMYVFGKNDTPYLLAAGNYAAADYKKLGYPKDRILRWGYFPPMVEVDPEKLLAQKKKNQIVWVARFIKLKHPEYIVQLGRYLRKHNIPFHIKMIGNGELLMPTMEQVDKLGLAEYIDVVGPMPAEEVRREFDEAQIALLTSDRREGWGAVVNEAMNSACAVVASDRIGSVSALIRNHENGMTYGISKYRFFRAVRKLLQDPEYCERLGRAAYHTIADAWNPQTAAERLLSFMKEPTQIYPQGPVSRG